MQKIAHILEARQHRPWPIPDGSWRYYQEWNDALFLHWPVPETAVQSLLPPGLVPDVLEGTCWISLVAFTMQQIRPRYMPSFPPLSDFHELNLRTYVLHDDKPGVYFLSIEAQKHMSVFIARNLSGLPYVKSGMQRGEGFYRASHPAKGYSLKADFATGSALTQKSQLDNWLTERYCLYLDQKGKLFRFDIHHTPWPLQEVTLHSLEVNYPLGAFNLGERPPELVHYSGGVQVIAWKKKPV